MILVVFFHVQMNDSTRYSLHIIIIRRNSSHFPVHKGRGVEEFHQHFNRKNENKKNEKKQKSVKGSLDMWTKHLDLTAEEEQKIP
jgi:hypothetical protein